MKIQPMIVRSQFCFLAFLGTSLLATPVEGQVFDSGPSDSALFDTVIDLPPAPDFGEREAIGGDGSTTQLNVSAGGSIDIIFEAGSGGEVNISGGVVERTFIANSGSEVNISGGDVGIGFNANSGSEVNISGGTVRSFFGANSGSAVNISGGTIGGNFDAEAGSVVTIRGGTFGRRFDAHPGSAVELIGGEFQLNGAAFSGSTVSVDFGDNFTGTLADGSAFIFPGQEDSLTDVQLTLVPLPALDLSPMVVSTSDPDLPSGLRPGQMLTLQDGGVLGDNFELIDATLNIEGGTVGPDVVLSRRFGNSMAAIDSTVNIRGGTVSTDIEAFTGSAVNISGGDVGIVDTFLGSELNISGGSVNGFQAGSGSTVNISGGSVDEGFLTLFESEVYISGGVLEGGASAGGEVNISGGTFAGIFEARGFVNISGGTFEDSYVAEFGSVTNLFGSDFVLDGEPLDDSLIAGEAFTITDRDVTLSGVLVDGSAFSLELNSVFDVEVAEDAFDSGATLTVMLGLPIPEIILGDCDQNGEVNFFDIAPFIELLASESFLVQADCDQDGDVNFFDIFPFIEILGGS